MASPGKPVDIGSNVPTPSEILELAKHAREQALLGNYESACSFFDGVLANLQRLIVATKDPSRKHKWIGVSPISSCIILISFASV